MGNTPFHEEYYPVIFDGRLRDRIAAAKSDTEKEEIFVDFLSYAADESPYRLWNFVWNTSREDPVDMCTLCLDYIVRAKDRWDPDQVACFLLEVADDRTGLVDVPDWLIEVDLPEMINLEYAGNMIWEMFWLGHECLIAQLINHYGWNGHFARELDDNWQSLDPEGDVSDYWLYRALAQIIADSQSETPISDANTLVAGMECRREECFYDAIPLLLEFHEQYPNIVAQEIRIALASCYLETAWRSFAQKWVTEALRHDPSSPEMQSLQARAFADDSQRMRQVEEELQERFRGLTPESYMALAQAEFLYRYHGETIGEYSSIISGYARAIEIQLKQRVLPKVRAWIRLHGEENVHGRRYVQIGSERFREDEPVNRITLATWSLLFREEELNRASGKPPHYCIYCVYESLLTLDHILEFGHLLWDLKEYRNSAAHSIVSDWSAVIQVRQMVYEGGLGDLLDSTTRRIFASDQATT